MLQNSDKFSSGCKSSETTVFSLIFVKLSISLVTLKALDKVDQSVEDPDIRGKVHIVVVCLCSESIELYAAQVGMYVANFPLKVFKILHLKSILQKILVVVLE